MFLSSTSSSLILAGDLQRKGGTLGGVGQVRVNVCGDRFSFTF